ncbi:DUF6234 family protein [Streptomyces sp. NPDC014864]|uniref:DUF6234 family protein n=1 Tax=Streptomyces sp. NPDC014864 TaxID=3364924 RepID=UPI0036F6FAA4
MTDPAPQWPTNHPRFHGPNVPPPHRPARPRLHPVGDVALAVGLLVVDGVAALAALLLGIDFHGWKPFDPGADNSAVVLRPDWLYVGIAGGVVLLTAPLLYRLRALVTTCVQVLAGLVVVGLAVAGAQYDQHRATGSAPSVPSAPSAPYYPGAAQAPGAAAYGR